MSDAVSTNSSSKSPTIVSVHHYLSCKINEKPTKDIESKCEFYMNENAIFPLCPDTCDNYTNDVYQNTDWKNEIYFNSKPAHLQKNNYDIPLRVLYSPHADIHKVLYSGVPSPLVDLAIRSNIIQHINSSSLCLEQKDKPLLCKLFVKTIFYIPNVESDEGKQDIMIMSSGRAIKTFWNREGKLDTNLPYLIYRKLIIPFLLGMKKNGDRTEKGQRPYNALYIDQIDLNWNEPSMMGIFFNTIRRICSLYPNAFEKIVICNCPWDMKHYGEIYFHIKG